MTDPEAFVAVAFRPRIEEAQKLAVKIGQPWLDIYLPELGHGRKDPRTIEALKIAMKSHCSESAEWKYEKIVEDEEDGKKYARFVVVPKEA